MNRLYGVQASIILKLLYYGVIGVDLEYNWTVICTLGLYIYITVWLPTSASQGLSKLKHGDN
jgi:hypothetical protein